MRNARLLGNYVEQLSKKKNLTVSDLSSILKCTESQVRAFFKGLAYASFDQLTALSDALEVGIEDLLNGDKEIYRQTVVHYMNDFQEEENREQILDLIEDYIDIYNSVNQP